MKKILEYKAFEILKDPNSYDFLQKVKTQNPDLYSKFMNIIGKKGLEEAKDLYKEYDPDYQKEKEKEEKLNKKIKHKENIIKFQLNANSNTLEQIKHFIYTSPLKNLYKKIQNDDLLGKELKFYKKKYKSNLSEILKKPHLLNRTNNQIDSLHIYQKGYYQHDYIIIRIEEYYNKIEDKNYFNIRFTMPDPVFETDFLLTGDNKKNEDFLEYRNSHINFLTSYDHNTEEQLNDIIFNKFKYFLSDKFLEDWKFKQDVNKYNI